MTALQESPQAQAASANGATAASDAGARRLTAVFFTVVGILAIFYGYLAWNAVAWSPGLFVRHADSDRSRIVVAAEPLAVAPDGAVRRGRDTYRRAGCALCHGLEGRGGVLNPNYTSATTPALDRIAEKLQLEDAAGAEAFIRALEVGKLNADELDVPRASSVIAQYESVRDLIVKGSPGGRKDPNGPPPFDMPAWKTKLTPRQIDDIIAYLVSRQPWEKKD